MLKVWLAALAPLLKGHPNHLKFLKLVTNFILIAWYYSHTEMILQYLQDLLHGIIRNIYLFLPYCHNQSISKMPKIYSLFHYIECIKEINSADNSEREISEAIHKNLIKDSYHASNKVDYILQMLRWETHFFQIKLRVSILLYMIKVALLLTKEETYRKLLIGDSHSYDEPISSLNPCINGVIRKCNAIASLVFPNEITISQFIQSLTSYFVAFPIDLDASLDL